MAANPTFLTVVLTKLNAGQAAANAGAGVKDPDGGFNAYGTVVGIGQTAHSLVELSVLGRSAVGKTIPLVGGALAIAGAVDPFRHALASYEKGEPIKQSDIASLVGSAAAAGGAVIVFAGASGPVMVALTVATVATSVVAGGYQLVAASKGWTVDPVTGRSIEVDLPPSQMAQVDMYMRQALPMLNSASVLDSLGLTSDRQLNVAGSLFAAPVTRTFDVVPPPNFGQPSRNSNNYIALTGEHTATLRPGGTLSDLWASYGRNSGGFSDARAFYAALIASNPDITDPNKVRAGLALFLPQRQRDGSTTYHYANGVTVNWNEASGEYHMQVPNDLGGTSLFTRQVDADAGFTVRQTQVDRLGDVVEQITGWQAGLNAPVELTQQMRVSTDAAFAPWGGLNPTRADSMFRVDAGGGLRVNQPAAPTSLGQLLDAEERLQREHQAGWISETAYEAFRDFVVDYSLTGGSSGSGVGLQPPPETSFALEPIGAFYDSQSAQYDAAPSIARHTGLLLDSQQRRLSEQQLARLDADKNGMLAGAELTHLRVWTDLDEDGITDSGEVCALADAGMTEVRQADWRFYSQGQVAQAPGEPGRLAVSTAGTAPAVPKLPPPRVAPAAPATPALVGAVVPPLGPIRIVPRDEYRLLRDSHNRFDVNLTEWIDWAPNQVKINQVAQDALIGTDGDDRFDASYYDAYSAYFTLASLVRFMAGPGNDVMGGSVRDDTLWGGTGNDTLYGYEGADAVYGDDGNDELHGGAGNDVLDGGVGDDTAYGYVGNDTLYGGSGNDSLAGYGLSTALATGETDDDVLHGDAGDDRLEGGAGQDQLHGGIGNDTLLGDDGDDRLLGGDGTDELQGNAGHDQLFGDSGDDRLFGQVGNDVLWGGAGNDHLRGFTGANEAQQSLLAGQTDNDRLSGEAGRDELYGGVGDDWLDGGSDNDVLLGGDGADTAFGGTGDDELQGEAGADQLLGGAGNDRLFGQVGNDVLWGGTGNDLLVGFTASNEAQQALLAGQTDDDVLYGEAGDDNLHGGVGKDLLDGGAGNDLLAGGSEDDALYGSDGNDELQGEAGADGLVGGTGDDRLFGQVGNDRLWGGDGNDLLMGFTGRNEGKQTLGTGETDDDILDGGAGSDVLIAGLGDDRLYGGADRDELQGNDGNDLLYGESGDDNLFGQAGDDVLHGGEGNDFLTGFTGSNETQQTLGAAQTDNDKLFGGAGQDTLVAGIGNDWLDGGAGADVMVGGAGDDSYVANSVNDVIYEAHGMGRDTVHASTTHLLAAHVEDLVLLEGFDIHGTGNAQDNRIEGNSADNILDGVTGADTMVGGRGNDTYYVDHANDVVRELADEGTDVVQSSISHALSADVENLVLLDFARPEHGLVDGREVLVYGYPKRNELDYMQGDAVVGFEGTCGLTSIANVLTQMGRPTTESQVVRLAINNRWTVTDAALPSHQLGGTRVDDQRRIMDSYGVANAVVAGYNESGLANLVRGGRGVVLAVNAGRLWNDTAYVGNGSVNHAVTLTGAVHAADSGQLMGFYLADSGRGNVSDMTRFVDIGTFRAASDVQGAYAIYSLDAVNLWGEDIDATGNAQGNLLVGNRGHNVMRGLAGDDVLQSAAGDDTLDGGAGNDVLAGGSGSDRYYFGRGGGSDRIEEEAGGMADQDLVRFGADVAHDQLWFTRRGDDLRVDIVGSTDSLQVQGWFRDEHVRVERFQSGNGQILLAQQVNLLVDAMASFSPPPMGESRLGTGNSAPLVPVMAANWQPLHVA